jgi:hypothetical protein
VSVYLFTPLKNSLRLPGYVLLSAAKRTAKKQRIWRKASIMTNVLLDLKLPDDQRRERIFNGNILLFSARPSTIALCNYAQAMIRETYGSEDPQRAQFSMKVEEFVARTSPLKTRFTNDQHTKKLIQQILVDFGCDLENTLFDVPRLRVVTHGGYLVSGVGYAYKAHRDIWYASPSSQVNWWMPVYPLDEKRSLALYPSYWNRSISNTSSEFDYGEWCRVGRTQATSQITVDKRKHPLPTEEIDSSGEFKVVCDAAAMIAFSASHLHATVPNSSGLTRFSIDFRTIRLDDLKANRGAPNIDSAAKGSTLGDFLRASDFSSYSKDLL